MPTLFLNITSVNVPPRRHPCGCQTWRCHGELVINNASTTVLGTKDGIFSLTKDCLYTDAAEVKQVGGRVLSPL